MNLRHNVCNKQVSNEVEEMKKFIVIMLSMMLTLGGISTIFSIEETASGEELAVPEIMAGDTTFDIPVVLGWNFISIPLEVSGDVPTVLDDDGGDTVLDIVQWYNPLDIADHWKTYNSAMPPALWDLPTIDNTMGLYVNITDVGSDGFLRVNGTLPSPNAIDLWVDDSPSGNWNMVGYPTLDDSTFTVGDLKAQMPEIMNVQGNITNITENFPVAHDLPDNHTLKRGEGYWFNITENCTWTVIPITITTYPEEMDIHTNSLTGSREVSFWADDDLDDVNVTILNSNRTEFLDEEVYKDDLSIDNGTMEGWLSLLTSSNYTKVVTLENTSIWDVHIRGDATCPDLDLAVYLDGLNGQPKDGIAQLEEIITQDDIEFDAYGSLYGSGSYAYCADMDADEALRFIRPPDGDYIIQVLGYTVNANPGHFDLFLNQLSKMPGIFNVTGVDNSPLPALSQREFDLTWNIPASYSDGEYYAGIYIGTDAVNDLALVPVSLILDRSYPDFDSIMPEEDEIIEDPMSYIYAFFSVTNNSELDRYSASIVVDGVDVTAWATSIFNEDPYNDKYMSGFIRYQPNIPLTNGVHNAIVSVSDMAGTMSIRNWNFTVDSPYQIGISHSPEIMTSVNYITPIVVNIESDFKLLATEMYYKNVGDTLFTMTHITKMGTNTYYSEIPPQTELGEIVYYLKVEDVNGNVVTLPATNPTTAPYSIEVYGQGTPKITHQPVLIYTNESFTINAIISDNVGINEATLSYRKVGQTAFTSIAMTDDGGHAYSANISSANPIPNNIEYFISANDGTASVTHPIDFYSPHIIQYNSTGALSDIISEKYTGGNLRVALQDEPGQINPLISADKNTDNVIDLVYDSLTRIDPQTMEIIPWVAESWIIAGNNTMVTVNIRENVTWHDGSSLTASDVKYTFDTYAYSYISSVGVVDDHTVIFILNSPDASLFSEAFQMPLFATGFAKSSGENGCGPFMLGDRVIGDSLELIAYEDYFMGSANVDSITFTYYPDDPVTYESYEDELWGVYRASTDLIEGELDYIGWSLWSNETTEMIEMPADSGNYTNLVQNSEISVKRNVGSGLQYIGFNTQEEPMNNSEFRRAVAHGVNKESLRVFDIGGGLDKADSILNRFDYPYCNKTLEAYRADVAMANNILSNAGFYDRDGDGWRDLPYSPYESFNITLFGPPMMDITMNVMAYVIVGWMQDIGINAVMRSNTSAVNMADVMNDDFDMYFEYIEGSHDPSFLYDLAHSTSAMNYANYNDTYMDTLLEKMEAELDPDMRAQYAQDCEGYLASQVPYIPVLHHRQNNAHRVDGFDGWVNMLDGNDNFWSYLNVYPVSDQIPMDTPLALHAFNTTEGYVDLTWSANDENSVSGYNIYRSNASGGPYTLLDTTDERTAYTDHDAEKAEDSYYVITAINPESSYSKEARCRADDTISPVIWATNPADGNVDIENAALIMITFSEEMDTASVENAFSLTDGIDTWTKDNGTGSWNMIENIFTFDPTDMLAFDTDYIVTINGSIAKDTDGNLLDGNNDTIAGDDHSWSFRTLHDDTPPKIVSVFPDDNSKDVPADTIIIIEFNMAMDATSVEGNITINPSITAIFQWSANDMTLTITPTDDLVPGTLYSISIETDIMNTLQNNLASSYSWSFITWDDNDEDGIPDDLDEDDDNDGFLDEWEEFLDTDPLDPNDQPIDTDNDGIPDGDEDNSEDWMDTDDDDDGVADISDPEPQNPDITGDETNYLWFIIIIIVVIISLILIYILMSRKKTPTHVPGDQSHEEAFAQNGEDIGEGGNMDDVDGVASPPAPDAVPEPDIGPEPHLEPGSIEDK